MRLSVTFCSLLGVLFCSAAAANPLVLEGEVPPAGRFFDVPFEVPPGTAELEVRHDDLASENILDWGLEDPNGFRGYGGGNEEPAIVGEQAASRSYLAGPLPAGTWRVTVGKAKIDKTPARYRPFTRKKPGSRATRSRSSSTQRGPPSRGSTPSRCVRDESPPASGAPVL